MSERLTLYVFKGPDKQQFRSIFEQVVRTHAGSITWGEAFKKPNVDCRTTHQNNVHTVYLPSDSEAGRLLCALTGMAIGGPWIVLRIQEGSHWDYSLYDSERNIDNFSTLPEYWDDPELIADTKGTPELLALYWDIPLERVERILRHGDFGRLTRTCMRRS